MITKKHRAKELLSQGRWTRALPAVSRWQEGHVVPRAPPGGVGPCPGLGVEVTPKAVEEVLHKIGESLEKGSAHVAAGTVGGLFLQY